MLIHSVYFWLKPELTEAQRADFRRGVESLAGVKSADQVYVGVPAPVPSRPVLDASYAVALTVMFRNLAALDAYLTDPLHLAFLNTYRTYWTRVQIYDAV